MIRENTKKTFMFVTPVVLILLFSMVTPGLVHAEDVDTEENNYIIRDPIYIDGNDDFAAQAAAEGWPGDGSEGDPYVIEGYEIDGSRHSYGIRIRNTEAYFIVRQCYVHDSRDSGFFFGNVNNGVLRDNNIIVDIYSKHGISLHFSNNNTIYNNTILLNKAAHGTYLLSSHNTLISNNSIRCTSTDMGWSGVSLDESHRNIIIDNYVSGFNTGILLMDCNYVELHNNTFSNNKENIRDIQELHGDGGLVPSIGVGYTAIAILMATLFLWKKKTRNQ